MDNSEKKDSNLWKERGNEFYKQGNYDEAIKCYREAITRNRKNEAAWYNLGKVCNQIGKEEESKYCFKKADELSSKVKKQPPKGQPIKNSTMFIAIIIPLVIVGLIFIPPLFKTSASDQQITTNVPPTSTATTIPTTKITPVPTTKNVITVTTKVPTATGLANPTSVYCAQVGGITEIKKDSSGKEYGACSFPSGSSCEEWALYRGECRPTTYIVTPNPTTPQQPARKIATPTAPKPLSNDENFLSAYLDSMSNIESAIGSVQTGGDVLNKKAQADYYSLLSMPVSASLEDVKSTYLQALKSFAQAGSLFAQGHQDINQGNAIKGTQELNTGGAYLQNALQQEAYSKAYLQEYQAKV